MRLAMLLTLALTGCSSPKSSNLTPTDERLAVSEFRKMSKDEISKETVGRFFDDRPYACDDGPLGLLKDGTFRKADGWGGAQGSYQISDGKIEFNGAHNNMSGDSGMSFTYEFFTFRGIKYMTDGNTRSGWLKPLQTSQIDEKTWSLSC